MAINEIHKGDIGTIFRVTLMEGEAIVDVSGATVRTLKFLKPDGTVVEKDAVFTTDGVDGQIEYVTIADDLDQTGKWKLQGYVAMPAWIGHSDIGSFKVHDNVN